MFKGFIERENEIFDTLAQFKDIDFILIGGYAVSSYKHRFSIDADIVIRRSSLKDFEKILAGRGYKQAISKDLENFYSTKFIRFEKKTALPVSIDLMIDGLGIRQVNGSVSFDKLMQNSEVRKIVGIEREITLRIPTKEMLIALKLNSGRLTDIRDVVALSDDFDPEKVKQLMRIGASSVLNQNIKKILELVGSKEFMDSYKGVFMEKRFKPDIPLLKKLA